MPRSTAPHPLLLTNSRALYRQQTDATQWSDESEGLKRQQYGHALPPEREPPKVLYVKSFRHSLVQFLIFHFPPVAVTFGLLAVYVQRVSWGVGNDSLAALLFAAKVHEALIIASLFHILFYHVRRGLLGPDGIPFGFLTAPFQLSSPFYLINSAFIAPILRYRPATFSSAMLATVMIITFTIAALSGASSGIVMIPRLDWWEIDLHTINDSLSVGGVGSTMRFYHQQVFVSPAERLYPTKIDLESYPFDCDESGECLLTNFAGLADEWSTAWSWVYSKGLGVFVPANLTLHHRILSWWDSFQVDGDHHVATIPSYNFADLITFLSGDPISGWGVAHPFPSRISPRIADQAGQSIPTKQPRLAVQCTDTRYPILQYQGPASQNAPLMFRMDAGLYPPFDFSLNQSVFAEARQSKHGIGFLELKDKAPIPISGSFWTWDPRNRNFSALSICFIDARWMDSDVWVLPQTGEAPLFSYNIGKEAARFATNSTIQTLNAKGSTGDLITLDRAWLESIDRYSIYPTTGTSKQKRVVGIYQYMLELMIGEEGSRRYNESAWHQRSVSWAMTVTLTNLISVVPSTNFHYLARSDSFFGPWNISSSLSGLADAVDLASLPNYAKIEPRYDHNIYEYNYDGTTTKLAWAVLLAHVLLVLVHLVVTCAHGSWQSSAWSQLGDLLALALNTRPTELLRNTGVSVKNWDTWRLTTYVRVSSDGSGIELDLEDKDATTNGIRFEDGRVPEPNQKYG